MIVFAAVRRVAGGAALLESGLMVHRLLAQIVDVAVTSQADTDRIGLRQSRIFAGMRAVAISAITRRAGMRNLGCVDCLGFFVVAGYANCLGISLRQNYFSVLCRRMAGFAGLRLERHMRELRHQLG